jgi:hypothetical protein
VKEKEEDKGEDKDKGKIKGSGTLDKGVRYL